MCSSGIRCVGSSVITVLLALSLGCASSSDTNPLEPQIRIEEISASEFVVKRGRAVSIAYLMAVLNPSAEPITLRRLQMETGSRSPYEFESSEPLVFDVTIEPGKEALVNFDTWVLPRERRSENVWVRVSGTAHFESATGSFEINFTQGFQRPE